MSTYSQRNAAKALNLDAERKAAEIRIRAKRKCGQLYKESEKVKGTDRCGTGYDGRAARASFNPPNTLKELGINKVLPFRVI